MRERVREKIKDNEKEVINKRKEVKEKRDKKRTEKKNIM